MASPTAWGGKPWPGRQTQSWITAEPPLVPFWPTLHPIFSPPPPPPPAPKHAAAAVGGTSLGGGSITRRLPRATHLAAQLRAAAPRPHQQLPTWGGCCRLARPYALHVSVSATIREACPPPPGHQQAHPGQHGRSGPSRRGREGRLLLLLLLGGGGEGGARSGAELRGRRCSPPPTPQQAAAAGAAQPPLPTPQPSGVSPGAASPCPPLSRRV